MLAFIALFDCLEDDAYTWATIGLNVAIALGYTFITSRWLNAAKYAVIEKRLAWVALAGIFQFCAFNGYVLPILSAWWPNTIYPLVLICKIALILSVIGFLILTGQEMFYLDDAETRRLRLEVFEKTEVIRRYKEGRGE